MNTKWIVIAFLSLVLIGCGQASPTPVLLDRPPFDALDGTSWELTHCGDKELLPRTIVSIHFEDFQMSGNAGCNSYEAEYDVRGEGIMVRTIMQTAMACVEPEGLFEQERDYLNTLQAVTSFELVEGQLRLITDEQTHLIFVPAKN